MQAGQPFTPYKAVALLFLLAIAFHYLDALLQVFLLAYAWSRIRGRGAAV